MVVSDSEDEGGGGAASPVGAKFGVRRVGLGWVGWSGVEADVG